MEQDGDDNANSGEVDILFAFVTFTSVPPSLKINKNVELVFFGKYLKV